MPALRATQKLGNKPALLALQSKCEQTAGEPYTVNHRKLPAVCCVDGDARHGSKPNGSGCALSTLLALSRNVAISRTFLDVRFLRTALHLAQSRSLEILDSYGIRPLRHLRFYDNHVGRFLRHALQLVQRN